MALFMEVVGLTLHAVLKLHPETKQMKTMLPAWGVGVGDISIRQ